MMFTTRRVMIRLVWMGVVVGVVCYILIYVFLYGLKKIIFVEE